VTPLRTRLVSRPSMSCSSSPGATSASSSDKVELLRILLVAKVERELLDTIRVLLPPEFNKKRRQNCQDHAQAVGAGMATAADSNKVAILGDTWAPMMDGKRAPAAPGPAARLVKAAIPYPDPLAIAAEEPPIEHAWWAPSPMAGRL
jgi:hypothetical protein